jgi:hypothetical protein
VGARLVVSVMPVVAATLAITSHASLIRVSTLPASSFRFDDGSNGLRIV